MRKKRKIIAYVLSMALMLTSLPIQLFAQVTNDLPLPISALIDTQTTTPGAIQINPNKYIGDGYEVEFKVTNQWTGAFNGEFVLTNTSDKPLENWTLKFDFQDEITNMWNAQIVTHEGNSYIIKNQGYNQDIAPGSSVNIGFQANWNDEISIPQKYDLLIAKQEVENTDYTIDFNVTSDWGQAFNGEISITNNTEETIEDWTLEFDFDRNIERFWTAEIVKHEDDHYVIKNAGYNANIAPGQTITLGFSGNPGNVDSKPTDYHLYKVVNIQSKVDKKAPIITVDTSKLQYDEGMGAYIIDQKLNALNGVITDDSAITSISYKISSGNLELKSTNIMPSKEWSIENIPLLIGKNSITIIAKDSSSNIGTTTLTLFNLSAENMEGIQLDQADDDSDGLLNYQEIYYNTDPLKPDTDGDGLNDYQELVITNTDPLKVDTDSNGITDDQEDFDQDSVKNIDELKLNGNPYGKDTDFDDLEDGQEIIKGTKLDEYDTDNDKLSDSKEIELGTDPLNPDTDGDGILDGDEEFSVTKTVSTEDADPNVVPTIDMEIPGNLIETLHISKLPEDDLYLPKEIPGYLGAGYEFELGDTFDKPATLTYKFNPEFLNREEFNPAIYYCDTENQEMVLLENQTVDLVNCTVTATVTHFSKYILIDKTQFDKVFEVEIKGPTEIENLNKPLDVVLVIDSSGSMDWNDNENIRLKVAKEFVGKLSDKDRVGIVDFDSYAYSICELTYDKEVAKTSIDSIDSSGGTSLTAGIKEAFKQFGSSIVSNFSLLATSEIQTQNTSEENQTNGLSNLGIQRIQTTKPSALQISFMSDENPEPREVLKYIIMLTDGDGDYDSKLTSQAVQNNVTIYTVGLGSDVDELLLTNIASQTGGKYYNAAVADDLIKEFDRITQDVVDLTKDSDSDGLSDYHEERLRWFNGITIKTDPNNPDTDGDGVLDGEEVVVVVDEKNNVHHYTMYSNPTLADTDSDGYIDSKVIGNVFSRNISYYSAEDYDEDGYINALDENVWKWDVSTRDLAILSQAIYCSDIKVGDTLSDLKQWIKEEANKGFYNTASVSEMKGWKLIDYRRERQDIKQDNLYGGFCYGVYEKGDNIVIVFRGSFGDRSKSINDGKGDWYLNFNGYPLGNDPGGTRAENIIDGLLYQYNRNNEKNVYIAGHSRGGFLAQRAMASAVNKKTDNLISGLKYFNSMGVVFSTETNEDMQRFMKLSLVSSKVTGYRVKGFPKGDVVSILGNHVKLQKEYKVTDVALNNNPNDAITAAHSMSNFTYYIMSWRYK